MSPIVPTKIVQIVDILDEEFVDIDTTSNLKKTQTSQLLESIATSKSQRVICKPALYTNIVAYALPVIDGVPCTYRDVVQSNENLK